MSERSDRRAAEHAARKLAFRELRQQPTQPAVPEPNRVSAAQLAANRANALLSTGAITAEGQARSCMNALKNGLTGKTVLLPHEDAAQYQYELDAYVETYKPATDEERRLVQSILDCGWRLDRIQRLESAILLKGHIEFANKYEDRAPLERDHLIQAEAYLKYERQLRNLNIQEARLQRTREKAGIELTRLQTARRRQELMEIQTEARAQKTAEKSAAASANGFEFSSQPNPNVATAENLTATTHRH